ncbi:hypothetical protein IW139_002439 [Coemansia sp. RSA 353]|nr:hypothetical protein GGH15_001217 [Coemansia sp. RSA 562]KAJ2190931.1 hypothetical protein EV181_000688 [Coemansia sp. RSA 532]KAJ2206080.1 hypothetical protein IW145_002375 [Coemansia sp. RSA 521]KAJ2298156.1 hypothetical protein IW139_002439 [Coemansia sp. RSA 353]
MSEYLKRQGSDDSDTEFPSFASAPTGGTSKAIVQHEKRHRDRHKHKRSRDKRTHDQQSRDKRHKKLAAPKDTRTELQQLVEDKIVTVDDRGDAGLLQYQQTGRSSAPRFTRRGKRTVLGLSRQYRISTESHETDIVLVSVSSACKRYMDIDWKRTETERIVQKRRDNGMELDVFIGLADRPQTSNVCGYESDKESGRPDFRSLDGMARPNATDSGPDPAADPGALDETHATTMELEARVRHDPHDIDAWQLLAAHQQTIAQSSFVGSRLTQVFIVQADVLRRALHSNPHSSSLALAYLDACAHTMDDDAMLDEWTRVVGAATDPRVVVHHVRFCQTSVAARFSVLWVARVYAAAVQRVICLAGNVDVCVVELVHCAALFYREAGFGERAYAIYQAALEWYVMTPEVRGSTHGVHRMQEFREFWCSGRPRVGAANAKGWTVDNEQTADNGVDQGPVTCEAESISEWAQAELSRSQPTPLTCATGTLDITKPQLQTMDPFALTVFEDVEPFLCDLTLDSDAARALVSGFMQFVGVVGPLTCVFPVQRSASYELSWTVPGAGDDMFSAASALFMDSTSGSDTIGSQPNRAFPFVSLPITLDTPDTPLTYAHMCPWLRLNDSTQTFAYNALELLTQAPVLDQPSRTQLRIALLESSFMQSPELGTRVARRLLLQTPECLALWNTLAKMHARVGDWSSARKVWANAVVRAQEMPETERVWKIVLCKSWFVLEATHGWGLAAAVELLACVAGGDSSAIQKFLEAKSADTTQTSIHKEETTQTRIVLADIERAQQLVADCTGTHCADPDEVHLAILTLRMWLAYAAHMDPHAADSIHDQSPLTKVPALSALAICSIHLHHARTRRVHCTSDLRARVHRALLADPHTTPLWEMLFACTASRGSELTHARLVATALAAHPADTLPDVRMLAVYFALRKSVNHNYASHVRYLLRRATRNGSSQSLYMWMAYIAFELKFGTTGRAKRVLLAALRVCPWAKSLYLLALGGQLASEFSAQESQALVRAMVRAGIRTRLSLACITTLSA